MKKSLIILALVPFVLSSCALGLAAGAGASVGVAAMQERGLEGAASDTVIRAKINDLWFKYDVETFAKLGLTVDQGRVLVTGVVQKPEARVEAIRLVWQVKGVKEVINEVRVANSGGITGYARDTWITTRLRTTMTFDRNILSINYSIETVQGVVYLMGVARNQAELDRVVGLARTIPDVKQVVSYVKMQGEQSVENRPYSDGSLTSPQPDYNAPPQPSGSGQPESYGGNSGYQSDNAPVPLVPAPVQQEPLNSGY